MSPNSVTLKTTVFIGSFFLAATAFAQGEPDGGVAPAPVELEEEDGADAADPIEPAADPGPATPADPSAGASVSGGVSLGATTTAGAEGDASASSSGAAVVLGTGDSSGASVGGVDVGTGGWEFSYHGYFRAPFRMGIGKRDPSQMTGYVPPGGTAVVPPPGSRTLVTGPDGTPTMTGRDYNPSDAYKETTFHIPQIPDDQYLSWQSTRHNQTDWAEMFFTVGNSVAEGTLSIEGFNFTQSSFTDAEAQFGIAQGYVTIRPELPFQNVQIWAKAGAHWNRYGMAGRYDAGEYDTYLFGRTKTNGITVGENVQVDKARLRFEQGFGGHRPHPSQFNTAKYTLLAHAHAFFEYEGLMAGLHVLHSWAQEEDRDGQGCPGPGGVDDGTGVPTESGVCSIIWGSPTGGAGAQPVYPVGSVAGFGRFADGADGNVWLPDGHMTIFGPEIKFDTGAFGLIYLGYSYINAKNALTVAPAVEVLHSNGGGEFALGVTNNYLDNPACNPAKGECSSGGTGTVHTIEFQYEFSLMNLIKGLEDGSRFWGEGRDFVAKLYAMYNSVQSEYDPRLDGSLGAFEPYGGVGAVVNGIDEDFGNPDLAQTVAAAGGFWNGWGDNYSSHSKLKFGADLYGSLFPAFAAGLRVDHVRPNSNISEQAFSIISPRVEFRSRWVTREKISIQYSRYMYAQRECPVLGNADYPDYTQGIQVGASADFDYTGSPQNWSGMPQNQACVQVPSGPRLPDGWGATALETETDTRGAPITGGNPNNTIPDENVISISASMWW